VAALVKYAGLAKPGPGWWDQPGQEDLTEEEKLADWHGAIRAAVRYWNNNTDIGCDGLAPEA
jgi:hypothetical protein